MINAVITGWGKGIPPAVLTNDDLSKLMDTSDEWIRSRSGIGQRHISHVSVAELSTVAAKHAIAAAGIEAADLDLIILATCSPDTLIPNVASKVQADLGAQCAAFDINAACSGFLYGLTLATGQIKTGLAKNILIIGAEKISYYLNWTLRDSAVLFGDGAGAVVLQAQESEQASGVLSCALNNDTAARDALALPGFGTEMDRFDTQSLNFHLQFDGREIFKRAVGGMAKLSQKVLDDAQLRVDDINLVVPHQANIRIIDAIANKLGVPDEKVFVNIANYGNTSAATVPIAIFDALEQGRIKPNETLLSCAFGAGLTSAACIIKWGDRVEPIAQSTAVLPPCEQTARELIDQALKHQLANPIV